MIITYHGVDYFKVTFGNTTIAVNPVSKDSKFKNSRFGADITLISLNSPEHNGIETTSRGDKESFLINGPGEYEVSGVFIKGIPAKSKYKSPSTTSTSSGQASSGSSSEEHINTIYTVSLEGMSLCFMGALSEKELKAETKEAIDGVDILFVPIGGDGVLDSAGAHKLAVQFEPEVIIPSHFGEVGDKNALKAFLKESGSENTKAVDKLTVKKKDLAEMEGEVVVLESI